MKIVVSGASGLVGGALVPRLRDAGHEVRALVREGKQEGKREESSGISWNVRTGELDGAALERWGGPEAVVHLAGESIGRRWTAGRKRRIRESRVEGTERLARSLLALNSKVFVGASAIGYYGNRGEEVLTEESERGAGFLAEVSEGWEEAAGPLARAGVRVAHLRFGMILSGRGGALGRMLPIFRMGLGGRLGSGGQWMSWVALEDVVRGIEFALGENGAAGAFNMVSPGPVRNAEFTAALGEAVHRPAVFPVPGFVLRLVFGEMAEGTLLTSVRVGPERLLKAGFRFEFPEIRGALKAAVRA